MARRLDETPKQWRRRHAYEMNVLRRERRAAGLCATHGTPVVPGYRKCQKCLDYHAAYRARPEKKEMGSKRAKEYRQRQKMKAVAIYGGKCQCPCGCLVATLGFLTIDHIDGGGAKLRKNDKTHWINIYNRIVQYGRPIKGLQLLCFNCNCGRSVNGGTCPQINLV